MVFYGGSGTSEYPYQITTWEHLYSVNDAMGSNFILLNNLDATTSGYDTYASSGANGGNGWNPIGNSSVSFVGSFDGQYQTISDLYTLRSGTDAVGLFGLVGASGNIYNLKMQDIDITGQGKVGAIAGYSVGKIYNCEITGSVTGYQDFVGGFAGYLTLGSNYSNFTSAIVRGRDYVGGFVGGMNKAKIADCYSNGSTIGNWQGGLANPSVGGFGGTIFSLANIQNCYAAGRTSANGAGAPQIGGFLGYNYWSGGVVNCFWDVDTTGQATSDAGSGLTTGSMMLYEVFNTEGSWDISEKNSWNEEIWYITNGATYPLLSFDTFYAKTIEDNFNFIDSIDVENFKTAASSFSFSDTFYSTRIKAPHSPIYMKLLINGNKVDSVISSIINKTSNDVDASSTFKARINNYNGRYATDYNIGDIIEIYADRGIKNPTTKIFEGTLEDIDFEGNNSKTDIIILSGRDYSALLQDNVVLPESYSNLPAGSIVKDVVSKYGNGITHNNVDNTSIIVSGIQYKYNPVYDVVSDLAKKSGYSFYVDFDKDLHFKEKSSISSNLKFDNNNIITSSFKEKRDSVFNEVWVIGDNYLNNFDESFTAGSPLGGSMFTLIYKPHNTKVTVDTVQQVGGIYGMGEIVSGTNYLVDYNTKKIIFTSGADIGDSIPSSGASITINYDRSLPIISTKKNLTSQNLYNKRTKTIVDQNIKDPIIADGIAQQEIDNYAYPQIEGQITIKDIVDVTPSNTCVVNVPWNNINNVVYDIIEAQYDFSKDKMQRGEVLSLKVNSKTPDITDRIKDIYDRLRKVETANIDASDIITRQETGIGSLMIVGSNWTVWEGIVTGSVSYLYNTNFVPPSNPFILASGTYTNTIAGSFTGSAVAYAFSKTKSGGQF